MAYIYNGILFSHEKEGNPAICYNMNEPGGHYAKWNKSEKYKYCMVSLIVESKKKKKPVS